MDFFLALISWGHEHFGFWYLVGLAAGTALFLFLIAVGQETESMTILAIAIFWPTAILAIPWLIARQLESHANIGSPFENKQGYK